MKLWLDAQLPPALSPWLQQEFGLAVVEHVADLGLLHASDEEIFEAAREADATVASKDRDFVDLLDQRGPPPKVLWITCGNMSNAALRGVLENTLTEALAALEAGEPLAEVSRARPS